MFYKKCNEKNEKKLGHDKKENNLIITPKWKTWNSSHVKGMMHSLEKNHELILNYMI
jgi:hypothetical protein